MALQLVALGVAGVAIDDVEVSAGVQCAVAVGIVAVGFHPLVVSSDLDQTVAIIVDVVPSSASAIRQAFNPVSYLAGGVISQLIAVAVLVALSITYR